MNKNRKPIRRQMLIITTMIVVLALLAATGAALYAIYRMRMDSERALTDQMEKRLINIVEGRAMMADYELSTYSGYIKSMAGYAEELYSHPDRYSRIAVFPPDRKNAGKYSLQRFLADPTIRIGDISNEMGLMANLQTLMRTIMQEDGSSISDIYYSSVRGVQLAYNKLERVQAIANGEESYLYYYDSAWYKEPIERGGVYFTNIYDDRYDRGKMISCSAPVYANGELKGVICLDILAEDLQRQIMEIPLPESSCAVLVGRDGNIIVDTLDNADSSDSDPAYSEDMIRSLVMTEELESTILTGKDNKYYAGSRIMENGWTFCIVTDRDSILEPLGSMRSRNLGMITSFLLMMLLIYFIAVLLVRAQAEHITRPLTALQKDAEIISSGNLDWKAIVYDNNEVGDLAQAFNRMTDSLRKHIDDVARMTQEKERLGTELDVANRIQRDILPEKFPTFPEKTGFTLFASMDPAREVGGDFYDFFMIDADHYALVIADVSDKGIPAALFMTYSLIMIHDHAMIIDTPAHTLETVNHIICGRNDESMFVTVWLGILELSTGRLIAANAGHEYPALRQAGGEYETFKDPHGLPLGAMDNVIYKDYEITLTPGSDLFVYSDGLPEAINDQEEQFGTDRIIRGLNEANTGDPEAVIRYLTEAVDAFSDGAPQFDDMTMLAVHYYGPAGVQTEKADDSAAMQADAAESSSTFTQAAAAEKQVSADQEKA